MDIANNVETYRLWRKTLDSVKGDNYVEEK